MKIVKALSDLGGGGVWNELKKLMVDVEKEAGGGINGPGSGGRSAGDDGGAEILLLLFVGFCLSLNLFNRFLIAKSCAGGHGTCFKRSLAKTLFPTSSSVSREPTIGFSSSKVEIFSKTSSKGFFTLKYSYL